MEVKLFGPVQLQVVVPEAAVLADNVNEEFVQVRTPPLPADAETSIELAQGPCSLNTLYSSI